MKYIAPWFDYDNKIPTHQPGVGEIVEINMQLDIMKTGYQNGDFVSVIFLFKHNMIGVGDPLGNAGNHVEVLHISNVKPVDYISPCARPEEL